MKMSMIIAEEQRREAIRLAEPEKPVTIRATKYLTGPAHSAYCGRAGTNHQGHARCKESWCECSCHIWERGGAYGNLEGMEYMD